MSESTRLDQVLGLVERFKTLLNDCADTDVILTQNQDEGSHELLDQFTMTTPDLGWDGVHVIEWSGEAERWVVYGE